MSSRISGAFLKLSPSNFGLPAYAVFAFCLAWGCLLSAQETPKTAIGTVTAVGPNNIRVKTDAGSETTIAIAQSTRIVRIAPGQKDLKSATPIQLQDLQVGDRALVHTAGTSDQLTATSIVVMKKADVAQKQQQDIQEWQRHGVGGIVRSVDAASGAIEIAAGMNQTVTVHTSPNTEFLRYAPGSVKFSDAKKGTIGDIRPGDQLRARGTRNGDGQQLTADAVIYGAFRNIAGTVTSVDVAQNSVTVMDLASRKPVTVKLAADSQMRKLPETVAQRIAMFLRRGQGAGSGAAGGAEASHESRSGEAGGHETAAAGNGRPAGPPDFQQLIRRMPPASISDLQKGQAVMMVTTQGDPNSEPTALTLLSGVEPILTAAPNQTTAANLLSGWSMGGGGEGDAASQ